MKKFEYKLLTFHLKESESLQEMELLLNKEGMEGWELISCKQDDYPDQIIKGESLILIFKKEIH